MYCDIPLYPFLAEFYKMMCNADEVGFDVYDGGTDIYEIVGKLNNLEEVNFGIIADVSCTPTTLKTETLHKITIRVELFSTYEGRKKIAEMINTVGKVTTKYAGIFNHNFESTGFSVMRMNVADSSLGTANSDKTLIWQNGYITLDYYIGQIE